MKFYIDSADIDEIRKVNEMGIIDGVTTNPSLIAKTIGMEEGLRRGDIIAEICREVSGYVSAEVLSVRAEGMYKEGKELSKIAENVVVKLPMSKESLRVVKKFSEENIKTNMTLVFSPLQALLAAKAGATLVSPFVGRLDDTGSNGMNLVSEIVQIYQNYGFKTQVLVASVRHNMHILESALLGADIVTVPFKVLKNLCDHPLTDKGLRQFLKDAGVEK